jgi:hypothetical protein
MAAALTVGFINVAMVEQTILLAQEQHNEQRDVVGKSKSESE